MKFAKLMDFILETQRVVTIIREDLRHMDITEEQLLKIDEPLSDIQRDIRYLFD